MLGDQVLLDILNISAQLSCLIITGVDSRSRGMDQSANYIREDNGLPFDIFSVSLLISSQDLNENNDSVLDRRRQDATGHAHLDIIGQLGLGDEFRFPNVITHILSYLTPKDLTRASCVNSTWRTVISSDTKSNSLRIKYLNEIKELRATVGQVRYLTQYCVLSLRLQFHS